MKKNKFIILIIVIIIFIITLKHHNDNREKMFTALNAEAKANSPECQYEVKPIDYNAIITMDEMLGVLLDHANAMKLLLDI